MQWNLLERRGDPELLRLAPDPAWAYFVHSYAADTDDDLVIATCDYGGPVVAAVAQGDGVGHAVPPGEVEPHRPRRPAGLRRARLGSLVPA